MDKFLSCIDQFHCHQIGNRCSFLKMFLHMTAELKNAKISLLFSVYNSCLISIFFRLLIKPVKVTQKFSFLILGFSTSVLTRIWKPEFWHPRKPSETLVELYVVHCKWITKSHFKCLYLCIPCICKQKHMLLFRKSEFCFLKSRLNTNLPHIFLGFLFCF